MRRRRARRHDRDPGHWKVSFPFILVFFPCSISQGRAEPTSTRKCRWPSPWLATWHLSLFPPTSLDSSLAQVISISGHDTGMTTSMMTQVQLPSWCCSCTRTPSPSLSPLWLPVLVLHRAQLLWSVLSLGISHSTSLQSRFRYLTKS